MRAPIGYRRRILAVGLIAAGALYSFGAPLYVNRIDLDTAHLRRVDEERAVVAVAACDVDRAAGLLRRIGVDRLLVGDDPH